MRQLRWLFRSVTSRHRRRHFRSVRSPGVRTCPAIAPATAAQCRTCSETIEGERPVSLIPGVPKQWPLDKIENAVGAGAATAKLGTGTIRREYALATEAQAAKRKRRPSEHRCSNRRGAMLSLKVVPLKGGRSSLVRNSVSRSSTKLTIGRTSLAIGAERGS